MVKQRGGNRTVFISIFVVLVTASIVIGVLFATGVLGKKSSSGGSKPTPPGPPGPKPSPLGPNVPNPNSEEPVSTTISNPVVAWDSGTGGGIPSGVTYNVTYGPNKSSFPPGLSGWTLNTTAVITLSDGTTETVTNSGTNIFDMDTIRWQPLRQGFGLNRNPVKADITAYTSYQNDYGNTINGPVSNTLSVNIPTNY